MRCGSALILTSSRCITTYNAGANDSSLAPKERQEREKRLALFQQQKPFRDEF